MSECSIDGCSEPVRARGWCRAHYQRWYRLGESGLAKPLLIFGDDAARFWTKVEFTEMCWLWTGAQTWDGYGQVRISKTTVRAHRWAYEFCVGKIPEGLVIDHLCRVPACVNPDHLEPVTARENSLRGVGATAIRARQTHCVHGHPLRGDNLYVESGTGSRRCRECHRERDRKRALRSRG